MRRLNIPIPDSLINDVDGYSFFSKVSAKTLLAINLEVVFDFGSCSDIDANLCAVIGGIINGLKQRRNIVKIINLPEAINHLFIRNGFLLAQVDQTLTNPPRAFESVQYRKFQITDEDSYRKYITEDLLEKPGMPIISRALKKEIVESIFEVYTNAIVHGNCEEVFSCGQVISKNVERKELHFTFVDLGKTIKNNVIAYTGKSFDGKDSIVWATTGRNSTKILNHPGGFGLKILKEFIGLNEGKVQIVSADGIWEYSRDSDKTFTMPYDFPGTIVNIIINLSDTKSYVLKDELPPVSKIF